MMLVSLALPTWLLVEAGGMEAGGTSSPARISGDDLCAMARSIDASNPPSFCTQASPANILSPMCSRSIESAWRRKGSPIRAIQCTRFGRVSCSCHRIPELFRDHGRCEHSPRTSPECIPPPRVYNGLITGSWLGFAGCVANS